MNDINACILKLKEAIHNDPLVKEFLKVKEAINSDLTLKNMQNTIISLAKSNKTKEMKQLKEEYDNHPLIANYNYLKDEINTLLSEIKDIIEKE